MTAAHQRLSPSINKRCENAFSFLLGWDLDGVWDSILAATTFSLRITSCRGGRLATSAGGRHRRLIAATFSRRLAFAVFTALFRGAFAL